MGCCGRGDPVSRATGAVLSVGQLAERVDLTAHTLRWWDREGIIHPDWLPNGNRAYTEAHVDWILFLKCLRDSGMPTRELKQFADLAELGEGGRSGQISLIEAHEARIREQQKTLARSLGKVAAKLVWLKGGPDL